MVSDPRIEVQIVLSIIGCLFGLGELIDVWLVIRRGWQQEQADDSYLLRMLGAQSFRMFASIVLAMQVVNLLSGIIVMRWFAQHPDIVALVYGPTAIRGLGVTTNTVLLTLLSLMSRVYRQKSRRMSSKVVANRQRREGDKL